MRKTRWQTKESIGKKAPGGDRAVHIGVSRTLEIWKKAVDLAVKFHRIAERLDRSRLYRYAEQLRAAGLSISNNIAEGSGSVHKQEFIQFLNITRRSLSEDASMLLVFERLGLLESAEVDELLLDCDEESRKITSFSRKL